MHAKNYEKGLNYRFDLSYIYRQQNTQSKSTESGMKESLMEKAGQAVVIPCALQALKHSYTG